MKNCENFMQKSTVEVIFSMVIEKIINFILILINFNVFLLKNVKFFSCQYKKCEKQAKSADLSVKSTWGSWHD